jgi:hypothetical protein
MVPFDAENSRIFVKGSHFNNATGESRPEFFGSILEACQHVGTFMYLAISNNVGGVLSHRVFEILCMGMSVLLKQACFDLHRRGVDSIEKVQHELCEINSLLPVEY